MGYFDVLVFSMILVFISCLLLLHLGQFCTTLELYRIIFRKRNLHKVVMQIVGIAGFISVEAELLKAKEWSKRSSQHEKS